jgi:Family of unknown function (DUF5343)
MPDMPEEPNVENRTAGEPYYPYIPFQTFIALLDKLKESGIPNRIDRSYLSYTSGSIQTYLVNTLKGFGLVDEEGRPTPALSELVNDEASRKGRMAEIVQRTYGKALALGTGATPDELLQVFRESYGLGGDTARKGITFFLNAANFAGIEISPHYKLPRSGKGNSGPRTRRKTTPRDPARSGQQQPPAAPTVDSLKVRYLDMLMKKAEGQEDMDENLLNRIEALLGYEPAAELDEPEE